MNNVFIVQLDEWYHVPEELQYDTEDHDDVRVLGVTQWYDEAIDMIVEHIQKKALHPTNPSDLFNDAFVGDGEENEDYTFSFLISKWEIGNTIPVANYDPCRVKMDVLQKLGYTYSVA